MDLVPRNKMLAARQEVTSSPSPTEAGNAPRVHALTTTFTPPSSCLAPTYTLPSTTHTGHVDQVAPFGAAFRGFKSECFPPFYWNPDLGLGTLRPDDYWPAAYFSPGVCPSGYTTARLEVKGPANTVTCCPSGMTVDEYGGSDCTGSPTTVTLIDGTRTWEQAVGSEIAYSVVVAFAPSDQSLFTPASMTTSFISTSTSTASPASNKHLSPGAATGIAIGALAILIIVAIITAALFRRRRRSPRSNDGPEAGGNMELLEQSKGMCAVDGPEIARPQKAASRASTEYDEDWMGWEMAERAVRDDKRTF